MKDSAVSRRAFLRVGIAAGEDGSREGIHPELEPVTLRNLPEEL